jgi:hypothetical protein
MGLWMKLAPTNVEWVAQVWLLSKLACRRQVKGGRERAFRLYPLYQLTGAPSFAFFCEGWDSQISPFNLPRKQTCSLGDLGFPAVAVLRSFLTDRSGVRLAQHLMVKRWTLVRHHPSSGIDQER